MKLNYDDVRDPKYAENEDNFPSDYYNCPICGKGCKEKNFVNEDGSVKKGSHWLHLVCGGQFITDEKGDFGEPNGDMGWYPVGAACWKKWLKLKKENEKATA